MVGDWPTTLWLRKGRFYWVLVGAVGIELKAALKTRKLLILLNEKNAKNTGIAQLRYTPGTLAKIQPTHQPED